MGGGQREGAEAQARRAPPEGSRTRANQSGKNAAMKIVVFESEARGVNAGCQRRGEGWRQASVPRGVLSPRGWKRGAGRAGPFSLFVADAAFAAPRKRKGLSAAIPQIASLPGASPTFSRHGGAMLRIEGRSHASHGRQH